MGMFSWKCKGCGHELIQPELVRLNGSLQTYDGYGGSAANDGNYDPSGWHDRCYKKASDAEKLDETPSAHAPNQGFGPAKLEFLQDYKDDAPTTYTVFVACGWYNEGDNKQFEFHLTNNDLLEDQKEYQIRYDAESESLIAGETDWNELLKLSKEEQHERVIAHQKKIEALVGGSMPSRNVKEFASIDEAIYEVDPLLLDLPESCKEYELQIHGKQGKIEGVVYHRTVNERWDRSGNARTWVKLDGFEIEIYRIGTESASNNADRLKLAISHFLKIEKEFKEASDSLGLAVKPFMATEDVKKWHDLVNCLPKSWVGYRRIHEMMLRIDAFN